MSDTLPKVPLELSEIKPELLRIHYYDHMTQHIDKTFRPRFSYDYEIELFQEGSHGITIINNQEYCVKGGDIIFRKPGVRSLSKMPYSSYFLSFTLNSQGLTPSKQQAYETQFQGNRKFGVLFDNPIIDSIPDKISFRDYNHIWDILEEIHHTYLQPSPCAKLIYRSNITRLLCLLYQASHMNIATDNGYAPVHHTLLKSAIHYIETHLDQKVHIMDLANEVNVSSSYIYRLFDEHLGITPNQYINKRKMNYAKRLLQSSNITVTEVALRCGYSHYSYFSGLFKKTVGIGPSKYRKKHMPT